MANFGLVFFIIFSLVFTHGQMVHHRFARSMSSMDNLLKLIEDLAFNLEYYAADLAKKAHTINKGIDQMMKRHLQVQEKSKHFWGSPFNSFTLIRHMKADWISWKIYMKKPVGLDKLAYLESKKHSLPQKWDFAEAAEGIRRMQLVYGMSAKDIANGLLNGVQYNSSLTARDCLEMGVHLMKTSRWLDSENWIREGFRALERSDPQPEMDLLRAPISSELYRTLARIRQMQNKPQEGFAAYQAALKESPHDPALFKEFQSADTKVLTEPGAHLNLSQLEKPIRPDNLLFTLCCNGRCEIDKKLQLYCVYNSTSSPFFRLAPLKVEILSIDPYIVFFHDIVSLKERKRIRKGSKYYLIPSSTFNSTFNSTYQIESTRISTWVWLPSSTNDLTQKLTNVMEDATGLDLRHSEIFQGINNGVGGLFGGQFDTLPKNEDRFNGTKDRIATLLYYLSDVPQGGGIVFTALNLTVFPQPGSVLFWYNLDNMGNEDPKSHHIGCPVIVGSKWVTIKWVNDLG